MKSTYNDLVYRGAVHLDEQGIPFPEIIREQMYLRKHYQVQRTMEVGDPVARLNRAVSPNWRSHDTPT